MRIVFAGTPEPAAIVLKHLLDSGHEVAAVLTRPDAPRGRGRKLFPSPVAQLAQEHGIEVLRPATLKAGSADGDAVRARLEHLAPQCIPVVAYGMLIPEDLLDIAPHGWVNVHYSLLPRWRGAAPVQRAIVAGDEETGVTLFRIDKGLDTGDILAAERRPIGPTDTTGELLESLSHSGAQLMVRTLDRLAAGGITPTPQSGTATIAPKLSTAEAKVDFHAGSAQIDRLIRAVTPAPGAWCELSGQRYKLGPVTPVDPKEAPAAVKARPNLEPGTLSVTKKAVYAATGDGVVRLGLIQPPGKKMMDAAAWARGANCEGMVLS